MKKIIALTFISIPAMAHDSLMPHNHNADGVQLFSTLALLAAGGALFAVLKKKA